MQRQFEKKLEHQVKHRQAPERERPGERRSLSLLNHEESQHHHRRSDQKSERHDSEQKSGKPGEEASLAPTLHIRPDPGWGTRVLVSGPDGQPLYGAEVFVDGERVGFTDAGGELDLTGNEAPKRVDVRYRGWLPADGTRHRMLQQTSAGEFGWANRRYNSGWYEVVLTPR